MARTPTILESANTPEVRAAIEAENRQRERLWAALDLWIVAYESGSTTLESLCRIADKVTTRLPEATRQRWLGIAIDRALRSKPAKRNRGNNGIPRNVRKAIVELVELIRHNERLHNGQAFERARKILAGVGMMITPKQVDNWYYAAQAKRKRAGDSSPNKLPKYSKSTRLQ